MGFLRPVADFYEYGKTNLKGGEFLDQLNDSQVKFCFISVGYCSLKLNKNVILLLVLKVRYHL